MSGLPEAESNDHTWMQPDAPTKQLPVAPYSEFNPPPVTNNAPRRQISWPLFFQGLVSLGIGIILISLAVMIIF